MSEIIKIVKVTGTALPMRGSLLASGDDAPPIELAGMMGVKYLFLEQRSPGGAEENEVTLTFQDARRGMASWLADRGSGAGAEYLPADALLAGYVSTREPGQPRPKIRHASRNCEMLRATSSVMESLPQM